MKKNVLLIDDEFITNVVNKMMLEKSPVVGDIQTTSNGKEAIIFLEAALNSGRPLPDVILLDINMPLMNGFQFLETVVSHPSIDQRAIDIVVLSSSFDPRDRIRAKELGIERFIEKPLTAEHIARYIN